MAVAAAAVESAKDRLVRIGSAGLAEARESASEAAVLDLVKAQNDYHRKLSTYMEMAGERLL